MGDGRADNQPEAARTIVLKSVGNSVPRDFLRPAWKVSGRRADNQPGAVRTSVWKAAENPVPRIWPQLYENAPNSETGTPVTSVTWWTAPSAGVGGVNSIAAVGVVWEWFNPGCRGRRSLPPSRSCGGGRSWLRSRFRNSFGDRRARPCLRSRCPFPRSDPLAQAACPAR